MKHSGPIKAALEIFQVHSKLFLDVNVKCQWKRISEFITNPVLFSGGVDPTDIVGPANKR
jgi:hypothetical protein